MFQVYLGILTVLLFPTAATADLAIAYSQSSDSAVVVSFFDQHTQGNSLVGTLQIQGDFQKPTVGMTYIFPVTGLVSNIDGDESTQGIH